MNNNYYINKILDGLSEKISTNRKKEKINIICEGGGFNGSYIYGSLLLLNKLHISNFIEINKISTASISSLIGLLFLANIYFDIGDEIMEIFNFYYENFRKNNYYNLNDKILNKIKDKLPENITEILNNKLYITYYNIKKNKQIVVCEYKSINHIFETIKRSCYIPYLTSDQLLYKNKYIDGLHPYIFVRNKGIKNLYFNLHYPLNKIYNMFSIKNEKNNLKRILWGIYDCYTFLNYGHKTEMTSYVHKWNFIDTTLNYFFVVILKLFIFCLYILYWLKIGYLVNAIPISIKKVVKKYKKYIFKLFII